MFVFCKVNILLFSSLLNIVIASVGRWVGGRWVGGRLVGGTVVGGFNKTPQGQCTFYLPDEMKILHKMRK